VNRRRRTQLQALLASPTFCRIALVLDLGLSGNGVEGINQLLAYIADQAGAVLQCHCELAYSPLTCIRDRQALSQANVTICRGAVLALW
jgi:hypothetical protein